MKTLACLLTFLLLALCAPGLLAKTADDNDYRLGADDVLDITIENHTDLNRTLTILPDGKISFPEVGDIMAAGKTINELASEIKTGLEKTRNQVGVTITVKELKSKHVRIVGAVKVAGSFELKRRWKLMDLLAMAGGLSAKPSRVTGNLFRDSNKELIKLDVLKATVQPDSDANVSLKPDDLIILDEIDVTKQVHILGEVNKPGAYDLTENLTVVNLISEAGSQTDKAALGQAYVLRGDTKIPLNLVSVMLKNQTDEKITGFKFQAGDTLFIPMQDARYAVLGQVTKPGYYPMPEKKPVTLLEALSLAGGQTQEGELRKAGILRNVNGKATAIPINIDDILKKAKLTSNVTLQDGDILFIPTRHSRTLTVGDFLQPITTILSFGLLR